VTLDEVVVQVARVSEFDRDVPANAIRAARARAAAARVQAAAVRRPEINK